MKILAIQNRMGIGDTVIFLPFIKALSKKYNSPISILVKENTKAEQFLYETNYIDKILLLERDRNNNNHGGFFGTFKLINYIKKYKFDKVFIFNSSLRFYLIAKLCGITEIFQYPLLNKTDQHIIDTPKKFLKDKLGINVNEDPEIQINNSIVSQTVTKYKINKNDINILLGIGGSGPTKRVPSKIFLSFIDKITKVKNCKFFLATGKNKEEQIILNEILDSRYKNFCVPLDNLKIKRNFTNN